MSITREELLESHNDFMTKSEELLDNIIDCNARIESELNEIEELNRKHGNI